MIYTQVSIYFTPVKMRSRWIDLPPYCEDSEVFESIQEHVCWKSWYYHLTWYNNNITTDPYSQMERYYESSHDSILEALTWSFNNDIGLLTGKNH